MKLNKFTIRNFRGIEEFSIEPNGHNVSIYGCNGAGKTTIADAFLWLLFGRDTFERRDYDLIPHKPGTVTPWIGEAKEPFVEALLDSTTFKKIYAEEWPSKGEYKGQYTGSKIHYYIDDLEVKAGDYNLEVSKLVSDDVFKLITNPVYFISQMSWQERRATLVKIAGDLNVEPDEELLKLSEGRPLDKFALLAKQNVKQFRKDLDGIPVQIKEAKRLIPESLPKLLDMNELLEQRKALQEKLLEHNPEIDRRRKIADVELQISEAKQKYHKQLGEANDKIILELNQIETELRGQKNELNTIIDNIAKYRRDEKRLTAEREELLKCYTSEKAKEFTGDLSCPTCNRPYPEEDVESANATFNSNKAKRLEQIIADGKQAKKELDNAIELKVHWQAKYDAKIVLVEQLEQKYQATEKTLLKPNFNVTDEFKKFSEVLERLTQTNLMAVSEDPAQETRTRLNNLQVIIDGEARTKGIIEQAEAQQKRVESLMAKEEEVNAELAKWEKAVSLCEEHVKKQAAKLEETVNGKFKIAKFKMFAIQKNGEEVETCDVIYPNGSTTLSTGERLQTGIDVINTLSAFYGVTAPIFVDNAESITKDYQTDAQLIKLIVSEGDTKLRVEVGE